MWKATGKKPKGLDVPPIPESLEYIWDIYLEIMNPEGLTFQEIHAYSQLCKKDLSSEEVSLIKDIDRLYWRGFNDD